MKMKRMMMAALFTACLTAMAETEAAKTEIGGRPESIAKSLRETFNRIGNVNIYGKVVDQDGNTMEGADVHISWNSAKWMVGGDRNQHDDWIKTDKSK